MSDGTMILEGIKVLDAASFIAGPISTTIMADFGAEVIKVEPPMGDGYRQITNMAGMPQSDAAYHWLMDNRSKRGLSLDLTTDAGREVLHKLVAEADVFVTNFMPSVREKLGLRFEDLAALNPRLIYASMSAYGETGPEAGVTGFDTTAYWARSGLMDLVRPDPDGEPARSMAGMGDHPTGMAMLSAIMLALYRRERTGKGGMVHTSLLANGLFANAFMAQAALCGAEVPMRPVREDAANALSNHYRCKDQRWFILTAANEEKEWSRIPAAIGHPELMDDPRFATQADRQKNARLLISMLDEVFAQQDMAHWRKVFAASRVTVGEVAKTADILNSEQALAAGMTIRGAQDNLGTELTIDSPLWVEGAAKQAPLPAPEVGEHNLEILAEAGYDEAAIADLCARGALGGTVGSTK
ncbi:MAG: CoA transferase [Rhodospirillaceae bacterium]|jgi:crotonobetainyl-CoA:carnitine CoA-transferase CaiB-like acyl-CoA transferase|nr:CoA transferase [Rhodospirillaceae bacterium]MBT4686870.1 CoA transferase [Rhodospirillaceae bacterium]MBT5081884.1 CoA transferase [Rhodospirillaceae bacterium]MBT5524878.1 CoA transferase [Rhodospirillaceae bacterium]MBT5881343.1 CoA transferase [Rhodospirillaceae bacterium]